MAGKVAATCCLLLAAIVLAVAAAEEVPETEAQSSYIVHVAHGHAPRPRLHATRAYAAFLRDHLPDDMLQTEPSVHYAYARAATGFAARLTRRQAAHLASLPSMLAVVPDGERRLQTTRSQVFLGLSSLMGLLPASEGAPDVVIGVIDSGVYPKDRASFAADPQLPAPPGSFRGGCVSAPTFNATAYCNNKLMGAKMFYKGYEAKMGRPLDDTEKSPLDTNGHGTHTASTAAGSAVPGASFFEYGKGRAIGTAPSARIASYKACWTHACTDSDVLAAFDEAIADGVRVISISFGGDGGLNAPELHNDTVALAAFRAVCKGIAVSAAAGNDGPGASTVKNLAPWVITVGASTIKRQFAATVVLGNDASFVGATLYAGAPLDGAAKLPLVFAGDVGSSTCRAGKLTPTKVAGKIVLCDPSNWSHAAQGEAVRAAGGAGAILTSAMDFGEQTTATAHIIPAATVTFKAYMQIRKYIILSKQQPATATILFNGTTFSREPSSARMASFSGRGPNVRAPEILKPDVTAPGVDILAAWTGERSPTGLATDTRRAQFNVLSGTSMACPHVSGVAAMLRQVRPTWSPAAIKSALMTTAYNVDINGDIIRDAWTGKASTPFVRGAGHVDPTGALEPGLIYDAREDDYVSFLCALGYTANQIALFTRDGSTTDCSTYTTSVGDLNYPAFSVVFRSQTDKVTQRRTVTNVGTLVSTYTANVTSPPGVRVTVNPPSLHFMRGRSRRRYEVTFEPLESDTVTKKYTFGSIVWSDGTYKVTSPIAITWPAKQVAAI
ncbi:hypothetical protein EJB05_22464, partial [Eragrostis curvula]